MLKNFTEKFQKVILKDLSLEIPLPPPPLAQVAIGLSKALFT